MKPMPSPRGTNRAGLFIGGKVEAAYDAAFTDESGAPLVDSALAHRILTCCHGSLSEADFNNLVKMLVGCDMMTSEEASSLNETPEGGEMASDAAMAFDAKSHIIKTVANRIRQYQCGQRSYDSIFDRVTPPHHDAREQELLKQFPDMARIRHA